MVKGLVELHGGTVHASSPGPGRGAEFVVRLPLDKTPAVPAEPAPARPAVTRRRILIIEDNIDVVESLRHTLELEGHEVAVAYTGRDGLDEAGRRPPEIVLCDIGLPDLSGYELARRLRADQRLRSTCLIAVSGYAQPEDVAAALAAGFDAHLPKPVNAARLSAFLTDPPHPSAT